MGRNRLDLIGKKFERLTVTGFAGLNKRKQSMWECECQCGKNIVAIGSNLNRGHTSSCGCLQKEKIRRVKGTHLMSTTNTYHSWWTMLYRCRNPKYQHYAGKGVSVCTEWVDSFENFLADMGPRPSDNHSIDRIDNSKGYFKENCRWATSYQQARNRTDNCYLDSITNVKF